MDFFRSFILIASVVLALYLATGGWVSVELSRDSFAQSSDDGEAGFSVELDGMVFPSLSAAKDYIKYRNAEKYFPWLRDVPADATFLVSSLAFGYLGGVIRYLLDVFRQGAVLERKRVALLALSAFCGLLVLGISYAIPAALTFDDVELRPSALLFLCVFSGMNADNFIEWVSSQYRNFLNQKSQQNEKGKKDDD